MNFPIALFHYHFMNGFQVHLSQIRIFPISFSNFALALGKILSLRRIENRAVEHWEPRIKPRNQESETAPAEICFDSPLN